MRSWHPIPPYELDDKRLLAEHNELLIMARTIAGISKGWPNHPETLRWAGHSWAMKARHDSVAVEMERRGFNHRSPWPFEPRPEDTRDYPPVIESVKSMKKKLADKASASLRKQRKPLPLKK